MEALVQDGLRVPPFDRHDRGDGRLRDAGLDQVVWRDWLAMILRQREILSEVTGHLADGGDRVELHAAGRAAGEVLRSPGSFCPGSVELQNQLNAMWGRWATAGESWQRHATDEDRRRLTPSRQRSLWKALLPFHDRLPTLSVFLVAYLEPVVMPLAPTTCLIAPADEPDAFGLQVVEAAKGLIVG